MNILVTGGCGFIGSNFLETVFNKVTEQSKVINLDVVTYAADIKNVTPYEKKNNYFFEKVDLRDYNELCRVFEQHDISHVVHLAAESHVDNSICGPDAFIESNIIGTFNLLKASKVYNVTKFHHVSTDEVYGQLGEEGKFSESSPYNPNNPYSASKAASDFLVRSYCHTYKFPATISNCSNNFGPNQHDEKFIPTIIRSIKNGNKIPVYGRGLNVRDWIYVKDHCSAIWDVFERGRIGETYCIGANCEKKNIEVVALVCDYLGVKLEEWVHYTTDRKGHDFRYAIDNTKIKKELGWGWKYAFEDAMRETVRWYCEKY